MRVAFYNHDGKGRLLADALREAGHEIVPGGGDVALIDTDVPFRPYSEICDRHDRVLLYPHGGGIPMAGPEWTPHPHTVRRFVPGPGQVDVLAACSYPVPVDVIGWPFSDRLPFRPCDTPTEVLFAPMHQAGDGWMPSEAAASNGRIHDLLAELPINLTVRYPQVGNGSLTQIGITRRADVTYRQVPINVHDGIEAISHADVVVAAEGTFPSLAIALGCPTVMTAQVRHEENGPMGYISPSSWDLYKDDYRYPHDGDAAATSDDLMAVMVAACRDDSGIAVWRGRFVGDQFDPDLFVKTFEAAS